MNNCIKIKNLSKKYEKNKSIKVLNNISFNFESGKIYSIIGPSGSGKSTLLNLLSLIDNPTSGSIAISNNKIKLINDPEIILADEPTGSLDFDNAKLIFKILFNLKSKNRIIIFATHNRYFADMADCKIVMNDGNIKVTNATI